MNFEELQRCALCGICGSFAERTQLRWAARIVCAAPLLLLPAGRRRRAANLRHRKPVAPNPRSQFGNFLPPTLSEDFEEKEVRAAISRRHILCIRCSILLFAPTQALSAFSQMKMRTISVGGDVNAAVPTCYWESAGKVNSGFVEASRRGSSRPSRRSRCSEHRSLPGSLVASVRGWIGAVAGAGKPPRVLLLHGADASTLEWRYLVPRLNALGVTTTAVDWWSGGWTERKSILDQIDERDPSKPKPWTLVQQHLHAFWREQLKGEPVIVVGASLGGAVALDFAASYPEAVAGLILLDAGGESYKSPPPEVVSALSPVALGVKKALAFITNRVPSEELRINSLHRREPEWAGALGAYLASGGYARRVGKDLIKTLEQPSLVIWGQDDPILPLEDAYAFEEDLKQCVGVREVPGCGHTPQLEDPDSVAVHVAQFAFELGSRG